MPIVEQPDITLVSTTESQAELDHATGPNWRERFDPEKAKAAAGEGDGKDNKNQSGESTEKKDETKTAPASETGKTASKEGTKSEDDEPLPKGAKKQIDRLTAKWREAQEEIDRLKAGQRPPVKETAQSAEKTDAEPKLEEYVKNAKTYEEGLQKWNKEHTAWVVRQERAEQARKDAEEQSNASAKEIFDAHLERLEAARTAHDDFDDAVKAMPKFTFSSPQANQAFQMAILETDNSAELMYHLAKNPDEMAKFAELSPVKVQMLIGRLSAKLNPSSAASSAAARTTSKTRTPAPTTPLRGSTTAPTDLGDPALVKDSDAWIARRQAQLSQKRRAN